MIGERVSHYTILEKIGGGGMGVVYKARDEKLQRPVAIKFLPLDKEATAEERSRFVHEARAASALEHTNVCTIHEVDETEDGRTFIVMAFYDGGSLGQRLKRGPLDPTDVLRIGAQIADGLAAAHARDIVHRDVKPANVMLAADGQAKLVDFGLARQQGQTRMTKTGSTLGTVAYMAPEQARGEDVDARADVYSLGAVLYEMVAGRPPFTGPHELAVLAAQLNADPVPLRERSPQAPTELSELVGRCLDKAPERRPSAAAVAGTLRALETSTRPPAELTGSRPLLRRPAVVAAVGTALVLGTVWSFTSARQRADAEWVADEAVPQIASLLGQRRFSDAFDLLREAQARDPENRALEELEAVATMPMVITTEPEGARVFTKPYAKPEAEWTEVGQAPLETRLPASFTRFRVELEGYEPVERAQTTWFGGFQATLVPLDEAQPGMVPVPGGQYAELAGDPVDVGPFWIDRYEVTNAEYQRFVEVGGYEDPTHWPPELARDFGSWEAGIAALEDATGRPGPAGWQVGSFDEGHAEDPVGGVSWYEATAYCASVGKRLPTLFHWSLATGGATDAWGEVVVMSNFGGEVRPVSDSQGLGGHGTYDMAGNVAEWTSTEARDGARYSLGGGWNDRGYLYSETPSRLPDDRSADRGFRCASFDAGDDDPVLAAVPDPVHDFADREFVTDAVFEEWRSFYQYDPLDLDARTESVDPGIERFDRETVSFTTPYGERMTALVFLPRGVEPPYQAVVYSPGGTAYVLRSSETLPDLAVGDFVLRSGRAFVYPIYRGSYERGWAEPTRGPADRRERSVQQTQDLMRTVDYLVDRDDIDGDRLAYLGVSAGAEYGPNSVAIESRFRAAIWVGAGYDPTHMQHEQPFVVPWNYAPHVTVPVLILNGSQDWAIPVETGQMPMVEDLGTPEEHKRHQIFDAGHIPTQTEIIRESLDWLDRYLGPVGG